jgi:hypothetical protein
MKRRNVQLAFIGENSTPDDAVKELAVGDEAIDIEVKGGTLLLVVPAGTPDERIFDAASTLGGELALENGLRLSFEIKGDAVGAQFAATAVDDQAEHPGLSALPDIPSGV